MIQLTAIRRQNSLPRRQDSQQTFAISLKCQLLICPAFDSCQDEPKQQQQADAEAHDAFAEIHLDDDAIIAESHDNWE